MDAGETSLVMRRAARLLVAATAALYLLVALIGAVSASAASPSPAWQINAQSLPANFEPGTAGNKEEVEGPSFVVFIRNMGGAPTKGEFKVEAKLPVGLALSGEPIGIMSTVGPTLACSGTPGTRTAICTSSDVVDPGDNAKVVLPVTVEATETTPPTRLVTQALVEGGGAAPRSTSESVLITTERPSFDFLPGPSGFYGSLTAADGTLPDQAGSQPFQMTVGLGLPWYISGFQPVSSGGGLRNAEVVLPRGFSVNPNVTPARCTAGDLERNACPVESQVGTVQPVAAFAQIGNSTSTKNLYNLVPAHGTAAELGFEVGAGVVVHLRGKVLSGGDYSLVAVSQNLLAKVAVAGAAVSIWGVPSDPSHDRMRGTCGDASFKLTGKCPAAGIPTKRTGESVLSMPADCSGRNLTVAGAISSWFEPDAWHDRQFAFEDGAGNLVDLTGCEQEPFEPSIEATPTTRQADSPTGLEFNLHQRQLRPEEEIAPAPLRDARVTLPAGMTVNPSSADGLQACTEQQIGYAPKEGKIRFTEDPQTCPNGSKVGSVSVTTPLLDHALPGAVYLAKPFDNPFGTLLSIYLAVEDEQSGIVSKLAGEVQTDPKTGQITAVFTENPELPLEDISLRMFGGNRASLQTPMVCGAFSTTSRLTPWSAPQGADATPSDSLFITNGPPGTRSCPTEEAGAPNAAAMTAGTITPQAGAYSPFVLKITRDDGTQRIGKIETTLPPGVSGKLAGIPYCSEAQIAAESASPSCPLASEVGTVTVGAGAGPTPYYVRGHAYLAGPYKGAPLSLVIITPAVAGPFDLGTVVVRTALNVNLETAQITAVSDPLPTIIDGIPLDVRSVAIDMGRPNFTLNPTSCNPMQVLGSSISTLNQAAPLASRFQVGGCKGLGFKPKLKISLKGPTKRTGHPALKAVVTYPKQGAYANIARAQVGLPHAEFLDQANLDKVCTQPELKSNTCPASSVYGHAKAWSPLLDKPLEGPVYLGVGYGHKLPDVVADLNGQVRILLHGRVDTTKKAGLRNTFEVVPDAPVSRFVLEMKGGKKYGLLVNSENVCRKTQRVSARFVAQNGKVAQLNPKIANSCKHSKSGKKHKRR